MCKVGSVALPKATCQTDSHCHIYIVIPLLIAGNKCFEGNWKAGCWEKKWEELMTGRQHSRLIHFLITGKYKVLPVE